jgi:hypothetical protein
LGTVPYRGWEQGRILLSDIDRSAEAAIGSTLVPYGNLQTWAPRLAALDPSVVAVQLVRARSPDDQREQPVVRVIGRLAASELPAAALALLDDFPQIAGEVSSGELAPGPGRVPRPADSAGRPLEDPALRGRTYRAGGPVPERLTLATRAHQPSRH